MGRVATIAVALTALAMVSEGQAEENRSSADYMVPLVGPGSILPRPAERPLRVWEGRRRFT
jgi:hypothetical protein